MLDVYVHTTIILYNFVIHIFLFLDTIVALYVCMYVCVVSGEPCILNIGQGLPGPLLTRFALLLSTPTPLLLPL